MSKSNLLDSICDWCQKRRREKYYYYWLAFFIASLSSLFGIIVYYSFFGDSSSIVPLIAMLVALIIIGVCALSDWNEDSTPDNIFKSNAPVKDSILLYISEDERVGYQVKSKLRRLIEGNGFVRGSDLEKFVNEQIKTTEKKERLSQPGHKSFLYGK